LWRTEQPHDQQPAFDDDVGIAFSGKGRAFSSFSSFSAFPNPVFETLENDVFAEELSSTSLLSAESLNAPTF
jgi:hypothetical protein